MKHWSLAPLVALSFPTLLAAQQTYNDVTVRNWLHLEPNPATGRSFTLNSDGSLFSTIPYAGYGQNSFGSTGFAEGMMLSWDPGKAAFRAAYVAPYYQIGEGSAAFGWALADGLWTFAAVGGMAVGDGSTAFGISSATGYMSFAIGESSYANGEWSLAGGYSATADGPYSVAFGLGTVSKGQASFATGINTVAGAYASTAVGRYNVGSYSISNDGIPYNDGDNAWIASDPVFEVGIGSPPAAENNYQPLRANALTVYKNGDVIIPKRQGDILMGEFGN